MKKYTQKALREIAKMVLQWTLQTHTTTKQSLKDMSRLDIQEVFTVVMVSFSKVKAVVTMQ